MPGRSECTQCERERWLTAVLSPEVLLLLHYSKGLDGRLPPDTAFVTMGALKAHSEDMLSSMTSTIASLLAASPVRNADNPISSASSQGLSPSWAILMNGNTNMRIEFPPDFVFPIKINLFTLFNLWYFGNPDMKLAPYRNVLTRKLVSSSSRVNYSKALRIMMQLEECYPPLKACPIEERTKMSILFEEAVTVLRSAFPQPPNVDASYITYYGWYFKKRWKDIL